MASPAQIIIGIIVVGVVLALIGTGIYFLSRPSGTPPGTPPDSTPPGTGPSDSPGSGPSDAPPLAPKGTKSNLTGCPKFHTIKDKSIGIQKKDSSLIGGKSVKVENQAECENLCDDYGCQFYVIDHNKNECSLFYSDAGKGLEYYSGLKLPNPTPGCSRYLFIANGADIQAPLLHDAGHQSREKCLDMCDKNPCSLFVYDNPAPVGQDQCFIKSYYDTPGIDTVMRQNPT